ncbi:MAG: hypothetical protein ACT4TC_03460 [Myxococcaceae bacterium]
MGEAVLRPLIQADKVTHATEHAIAEAAAKAERRLRSLPVNVSVTSGCLLVVAASAFLGNRSLFGALTPFRVMLIVGTWWTVFEAATVAFWRLGPSHAVTRATSAVDQMGRSAALMVMLALSGSAALAFYVASLVRGFAWQPLPVRELRRGLALNGASHAAVAAVCLIVGRAEVAALVTLALGAFALGRNMTGNALARTRPTSRSSGKRTAINTGATRSITCKSSLPKRALHVLSPKMRMDRLVMIARCLRLSTPAATINGAKLCG